MLSLGGHKVCSRSCGGQSAAGGIRHQVHQIPALFPSHCQRSCPLCGAWTSLHLLLFWGLAWAFAASFVDVAVHAPASSPYFQNLQRGLLCPCNNVDAIGLCSRSGFACRRIAWVSFWSQLSLAIISAIVVAFTMSSSSNVRLSRLLHAPVLTHAYVVPCIGLSRLLHAPVLTHVVQCHVSGFPGCYMLSASCIQYSAIYCSGLSWTVLSSAPSAFDLTVGEHSMSVEQ